MLKFGLAALEMNPGAHPQRTAGFSREQGNQMLEIRGITKTYEQHLLLRGIQLIVKDGEILSLLGPSGSGKSTLLRMVAGLEELESGDLYWDGQRINDLPPHQRGFGLMFQNYALFPHLNVEKNIAFGLEMRKKTPAEIEKRVEEMLELVHLESFRKRSVQDLSGGEQQRVALARTLAPEPRLMMLDEPMAALDRSLRTRLTQELREILRKTGIPVIYVTHDQQEAFAISDRMALIQFGLIAQEGTPEEVFRSPENLEIAQFFGLTNLLTGRIQQIDPLRVSTSVGIFTCRVLHHRAARQVGEEVTLLLHPAARIGSEGEENTLCGIVKDCLFVESGYLVRLNVTGRDFTFNCSQRFQIGEKICLQLDREAIQGY